MSKITERQLRKAIREAIVNYRDVEYNIPDEEAEAIQQQIEFGDADPTPENSRRFNVDSATSGLISTFGEESGAELSAILSNFSEKIRSRALKIIGNNTEEIKQHLFSVVPSLKLQGSLPGDAWIQLSNLDEKGLGKGEVAIALLMQGVQPDGGGGAHDLSIAGVGDVHVKDVSGDGKSAFQNPDLRMGKQINRSDRTNWYQSLENGVPGWEGKSLSGKIVMANGKAILDSFAELLGQDIPTGSTEYDALADQWQEDFTATFLNSESWGDAAGLLIIDSNTGNYLIAGPDDMVPARIDQGKWRAGLATRKGTRWADALKSSVKNSVNESKNEIHLVRQFIREALLTEAFTKTDERAIETMARQQIDKKWKEHAKKIDKMFDDRDKTLFRNDAFYKVIARIYQELQRAYAEDQFKYATRYTRKDIPLARFRPS